MRKTLTKLVGSAGIFYCTWKFVGDLVLCSGPSMEPTIYANDVLLTEHISPRLRRIDRGQVLIVRNPSNPTQFICKRVKGLPGDRIKTGFASYEVVPAGHVWLEGDNLQNSADSRYYGPVPQGLIQSRVMFKVWPLKNAKSLMD